MDINDGDGIRYVNICDDSLDMGVVGDGGGLHWVISEDNYAVAADIRMQGNYKVRRTTRRRFK